MSKRLWHASSASHVDYLIFAEQAYRPGVPHWTFGDLSWRLFVMDVCWSSCLRSRFVLLHSPAIDLMFTASLRPESAALRMCASVR